MDEKGISDFIETHRPAGESPYKYNENHFFVFYEDGETFNKHSKLNLLHRNLRDIETKILESRKENAMTLGEVEFGKKQIESEKKGSDAKKTYEMEKLIKEQEKLIFTKERLIEMEEAHARGLRKLIKEVEKEQVD